MKTRVELSIIAIWAVWVGRAYLNFDPMVWPIGNEWPSSIQTHFIWELLGKCGACVFWNGFVRGGAPAFAELHGSPLYPPVIIATLLFGAVNGAKLVMVASLAMAGIAQWWLGRALGLGRVARMYGALAAVVGGHMAAKAELGITGIMISMAAYSLCLAPMIELSNGNTRAKYSLGLMAGLLFLSGQGYMQAGFVLGVLLAACVLLIDKDLRVRPVWKQFAQAGLLGLLVASVFILPMAHFYPNTYKWTSPDFESVQAIENIPINLIVSDVKFYSQPDILHKWPYPNLYANFIGWTPIVLALLALRLCARSQARNVLFMIAGIAGVYMVASAQTLRLIAIIAPEFATGIRHASLIAGMANPLILGLAAIGVDKLLARTPKLNVSWGELSKTLSPTIVIAGALLISLQPMYNFGRNWLVTYQANKSMYALMQSLKTETAQWVDLPFGEHAWTIPALQNNLKLATGIRAWFWKGHEDTPRFMSVNRPGLRVEREGNEYAYITSEDGMTPCAAKSTGGKITVTCNAGHPGSLIVHENYFTGWLAWRDGKLARMIPDRWLRVDAPQGQHTFSFLYLPADSIVGAALSCFGIAIALRGIWYGGGHAHPTN